MRIVKSPTITWIDIKPPTEEDVEYLKKNFSFHPFILKSVLPPIRHPRFENYGDYLFLVLHFPFFRNTYKKSKSNEIDILVTKDTLVTIHYHTILPLHSLLTNVTLYKEKREEFTDEGVGEILYRLLNEFLIFSFPKLDIIDEKIDEIERQIFEGKQKEAIEEISVLKYEIIDFQRIIQPQIIVFESLKKASKDIFGGHFYPYFNELFNRFLTIREILQTHHQTLNELEQTNSNLLSIRTNEIIKILTIFTVILTPLALIANIYGMNTTYLPFTGKNFDFWIVLGIMTFFLFGIIVYFKRKKWM